MKGLNFSWIPKKQREEWDCETRRLVDLLIPIRRRNLAVSLSSLPNCTLSHWLWDCCGDQKQEEENHNQRSAYDTIYTYSPTFCVFFPLQSSFLFCFISWNFSGFMAAGFMKEGRGGALALPAAIVICNLCAGVRLAGRVYYTSVWKEKENYSAYKT